MRNIVVGIDRLLKSGKRHSLYNMPSEPYTRDIVEHWCRYHWGSLQQVADNGESGSEFENDLHLIWIDLSEAIKGLPRRQGSDMKSGPPREGDAIDLLLEGYPLYGKGNIGLMLGLRRVELKGLLQNAYRLIADQLEPRKRKDEEELD